MELAGEGSLASLHEAESRASSEPEPRNPSRNAAAPEASALRAEPSPRRPPFPLSLPLSPSRPPSDVLLVGEFEERGGGERGGGGEGDPLCGKGRAGILARFLAMTNTHLVREGDRGT